MMYLAKLCAGQFIQQHKGGFQGSLAVARVPKFAVHKQG